MFIYSESLQDSRSSLCILELLQWIIAHFQELFLHTVTLPVTWKGGAKKEGSGGETQF